MSEPREEAKPEIAAPDEPAAAPAPAATASPWRGVALALAVVLLVAAALVGTSPYWAASLPWAPAPAEPALGPRLDRLEAEQQQIQQQRRQDAAATAELRQHLATLEGKAAENAGPAAAAAIEPLERRVSQLEARPAIPSGDIAELRRRADAADAKATQLAARFDAAEKAVQRQALTGNDTAVVLVLLQIREAIDLARPFPAEYETLLALARGDPEIAAAAAPLAEPAKSGVPGRAALAERLRGLRQAIAAAETAAPPSESTPPASGWTGKVLARLSGLVRIRRVDAAGDTAPNGPPPAAVDVALEAMAGGDLAAAVASLDKLTGASAEAAAPWLRMAKQRLAVETQLRRVELLMAARLGTSGDAAAAPGPSR